MGHRKTERIKASIKVRIWGLDSNGNRFNTEVETVDVSLSGACLTGVNVFDRPGETIGAQVGDQKGRFQVVWVGKGEKQGMVGIQSLDPRQCIWNAKLPRSLYADDYRHPDEKAKQEAPRMKVAKTTDGMFSYLEYSDDRRVHKRLPVTAGVKIQASSEEYAQWGTCKNISARGCYAELPMPLPVDCRIEVTFRVNGRQISALGIVRNKDGARGMGIEFVKISKEDQQVLLEASKTEKSDIKLW
jgi:hypothetical protein